MKVFREFGLWPVLGFLLLTCSFCGCSDQADDDFSHYDSYEDTVAHSSSTTSRTTMTTDTGTGTEQNAPVPHVIAVDGSYRYYQKIECRGAHVSNLSIIFCDSSIIECRKKLPCLINGTMCTSHDEISSGEDCFAGQSYYSRFQSPGTGSERCLRVSLSWPPRAGIIKCISSLQSSSFSSSLSFSTGVQPKPNTMTTTIDYFYLGTDAKVHLMSALEPPFKSSIKLGSNHGFGFGMKEEEQPEVLLVYTNEEIPIYCTVANFILDLTSFKIEARTGNGTEYKIDPALFYKHDTFSRMGYGIWYKGMNRFRVAKDIHSFSCVGRRLDTLEIIKSTINITVIDPPSQLFVKSPNGSKFQVNSKLGCNLSPPPPSQTSGESKNFKQKLFNLLDVFRHSNFWITSPIQFLRFQNLTQGNFSCKPLTTADGNSNSNDSTVLTERFDYYFDLEVKRPKIEKPDGNSLVILKGHSRRSLSCTYTGNPMPYVIWLRNGKEILYTVPTTGLTRQGDFEEAVLRLDNLTGISSDSSDETLVYSCIAKNHLDEDRLNFIIEDEHTFACASKTKSDDDNTGLLIYALIISCLCILHFIGLAVYFIRRKRDTKKRAVVVKCRSQKSGAHCVHFEGGLNADSGNLGNHSQSQSHQDTTNTDLAHGISIPSQSHSGDAKYKILTLT